MLPTQTGLAAWIRSKRKYINQTYAAVVASFTYFAMGEIRSWSASSIPSIQGKDGRNATLSEGPLPMEITSWITSSPPLGAIFAALAAGFVLQKWGRKVTLLISVAITIVAFTVLASAKYYEISGLMIASRAMMGITVGFSMPSATIYISECTDPKIRGVLGSLPAVFMALGISYVYLLGTFLPWHILSFICAAVPLLTFIGILFTPESPYWLFANGKVKEAETAYNWLNDITKPIVRAQLHATLSKQKSIVPDNVSNEDEDEEDDPSDVLSNHSLTFAQELRTRSVCHPFILCIVIMVFQQWSGVNAIVFNTVTIFNAAKVTMNQYMATNIVGAVQLVATFLSILVVDRAGRRILLFISGIIMAIAMGTLGAFFYLFSEEEGGVIDTELRDQLECLPLLSLIVYMIGYSIGYACVPFLLLGEMLPARMKSVCGAIVSSFNLGMTFLVLKFFPTMYMGIGFHGVFWIYAGVSLVGGFFGYIFIPETKGKTLKEIEAHFRGLEKVDNSLPV